MIRHLLLMASCLVLSACDGPIVFMGGGALSGTVAEAPETWQLASESGLAQLETRPDDPYSVNLAYIQMAGRLYVYAGDTRTNWVRHIEANPNVRIRIDDTVIYPAVAVRVTDQDELAAFAAMWTSRGTFQRDPLQFDEVWLYRLEAG